MLSPNMRNTPHDVALHPCLSCLHPYVASQIWHHCTWASCCPDVVLLHASSHPSCFCSIVWGHCIRTVPPFAHLPVLTVPALCLHETEVGAVHHRVPSIPISSPKVLDVKGQLITSAAISVCTVQTQAPKAAGLTAGSRGSFS